VTLRLRSLLVVPGNRPERIAKAAGYGADALALDLEDSVPPAEHDAARGHVRAYVETAASTPVFVRTVSVGRPEFADDLDAVVVPGLAGLVLPQVEEPDEVRAADEQLSALERERGLEPGSVLLMPAAESARAVRRLYEIVTASPRVAGTNFNGAPGGDLCRDLGATPSAPDAPELLYVRSKVLFESRAAGLDVILDAVFVDLDDDDGFVRDTELGRRIGFTGRTAIHPKQIETINRVHSPSPEEVEDARSLVETFRAAEADGLGAIRHRGRLVDYAMVREAERLLERAGA
jgi:citrate lyase subunit beta/citryl-CoA lyase